MAFKYGITLNKDNTITATIIEKKKDEKLYDLIIQAKGRNANIDIRYYTNDVWLIVNDLKSSAAKTSPLKILIKCNDKKPFDVFTTPYSEPKSYETTRDVLELYHCIITADRAYSGSGGINYAHPLSADEDLKNKLKQKLQKIVESVT